MDALGGIALLLLACRDPDSRPPGGPGPTGPTGSTPPPPGPTTPAPVPLLGDALTGRCADPTPTGVPTLGDDLHRATLSDPDAVCNDGSPAILWVRAGTPEHAGDWVMYLDGGRFCMDHETCASRWCGEGSYDASKMSSRWAPERRSAFGLAGSAAGNPFRDWNQVSFHYCSSDRWTGTRRDVVLDGDPPYRLHFAGADIVEAARGALVVGLASDDGVALLPSLLDAERVLFTGSSAGGRGAMDQLDRMAEALPWAAVSGVVDATFDADRDLLDPVLAAAIAADLEAEEGTLGATWGKVGDTSCAAAGLGWECGDAAILLREHLSTPFFYHHDLFDPDIYELGFAGLGFTQPEFVEAGLATIGRWEAEGSGGSFLLTGCRAHTYLSADDRFLAFRTADADGRELSLADALDQWLGGATIRVADDAARSRSTCP